MRDIIISHLIINFIIFREKRPHIAYRVISSQMKGDATIIHDDSVNIPVHIFNVTLAWNRSNLFKPTSEHLVATLKREPFLVVTDPDLTNWISGIFSKQNSKFRIVQ